MKDGEDQTTHRDALLGRTLIAAKRRGKQMWLELSAPSAKGIKGAETNMNTVDVDLCVLIHLGMTGSILLKGGDVSNTHLWFF